MKKGTTMLLAILGIAVILYFGWSGIHKWWKPNAVTSNTSQSTLKPEPPQTQPLEIDLPLDSKDAAVACGKTLKLEKSAFVKLDLMTRFSQLVDDSGFTDEERKALDLGEEEFKSYSLAYLTWEKPAQLSRTNLDKMVIDADSSVDKGKLSPAERTQFDAYMVKYKRMMVEAFDLGRHEARISPCPY